jgi:thiosulfate/3-mercaptopyruvate sulfurtransferase
VPNELPPLADLTALVRRLGITGGPGERIVIYGEDEGLLAARAYVALDYLGLAGSAALLDGRRAAWESEQRPLTADVPVVASSSVVPRLEPDRVVGLNVVQDVSYALESLPAAQVALIDARPAAQYTGADPGDAVARPGHIPGAANVFWKDNLQGPGAPRLRAPEELRALYARAGVAPGDVVVTYCRTGAQASYTYFVLAYLGYDVHLYDGSFVEWSAAPGTAVGSG